MRERKDREFVETCNRKNRQVKGKSTVYSLKSTKIWRNC